MRNSLFIVALCLIARSTYASGPLDGLSPLMRTRVVCSIAAAMEWKTPTDVVLAVAQTEGGKPGQWVQNRNGTYDVGPMQFNTRYLKQLKDRYGIVPNDVAGRGCYPFRLAAWRLRKHWEQDKGDRWKRWANYHSRTPSKNLKYRRRLKKRAQHWRQWLSKRFKTKAPRNGRQARTHRVPRPPSESVDRRGQSGQPTRAEATPLDLHLTSLLPGSSSHAASNSIGTPHQGKLAGAVQVPAHPAYVIRNPARSWATATTVEWLVSAFDSVREADGGRAPKIRVHDLSRRNGGPINDHHSHESGRDVDLTYFQKSCRGSCPLKRVTPKTLDASRQWALLRPWLLQGRAEFIFIDYPLQGAIHGAAKAAGVSSRDLERWFQYPHGHNSKRGIIRHIPHHANHVHVRFRCPKEDQLCKPSRIDLDRPNGIRVANMETTTLLPGANQGLANIKSLL